MTPRYQLTTTLPVALLSITVRLGQLGHGYVRPAPAGAAPSARSLIEQRHHVP
jgi:hypothetical protein